MPKKCSKKEGYQFKEGEHLCPHCKGDRFVEIDEAPGYIKTCSLCEGAGKVDWIKKATGYVRTKNTKTNWAVPSNGMVKPAKGVVTNGKN